jgi:uncharacterized protein YidB (DUF937 family)
VGPSIDDNTREIQMGLLDILNGMQGGTRDTGDAPASASGGGMQPIMMALLGLLAYKATKGGGLGNMLGGGTQDAQPAGANAGGNGGGLGDMLGGLLGGASSSTGSTAGGLSGMLGSMLGGSAAGTTLSGGLSSMLQDFEDSGRGDVAKSWVGSGPNRAISPDDLEGALGGDTIDALSGKTGVPRDELLSGLSQHLPQFVDQLTPNGRMPTEQESARWV